MEYVTIANLFILGVLGAASLVIAKKPNAKELIDKISPYQGWIGAISACWGIWWLINWVLNISAFSTSPVAMVTWLAVALVMIGLGLLLGIGVLKTFIKNEQAVEKMNETVKKLSPFQGIMGLVAIGLSIWYVLCIFVIYA